MRFADIVNAEGHQSSLGVSDKRPEEVLIVGVIAHSSVYKITDLINALESLRSGGGTA